MQFSKSIQHWLSPWIFSAQILILAQSYILILFHIYHSVPHLISRIFHHFLGWQRSNYFTATISFGISLRKNMGDLDDITWEQYPQGQEQSLEQPSDLVKVFGVINQGSPLSPLNLPYFVHWSPLWSYWSSSCEIPISTSWRKTNI